MRCYWAPDRVLRKGCDDVWVGVREVHRQTTMMCASGQARCVQADGRDVRRRTGAMCIGTRAQHAWADWCSAHRQTNVKCTGRRTPRIIGANRWARYVRAGATCKGGRARAAQADCAMYAGGRTRCLWASVHNVGGRAGNVCVGGRARCAWIAWVGWNICGNEVYQ